MAGEPAHQGQVEGGEVAEMWVVWQQQAGGVGVVDAPAVGHQQAEPPQHCHQQLHLGLVYTYRLTHSTADDLTTLLSNNHHFMIEMFFFFVFLFFFCIYLFYLFFIIAMRNHKLEIIALHNRWVVERKSP